MEWKWKERRRGRRGNKREIREGRLTTEEGNPRIEGEKAREMDKMPRRVKAWVGSFLDDGSRTMIAWIKEGKGSGTYDQFRAIRAIEGKYFRKRDIELRLFVYDFFPLVRFDRNRN